MIGVSKLCCPICKTYLNIIQGGLSENEQFLVHGAHDCITACTLPPWTPLSYLEDMNEFWAKKLRNDFLHLMAVDSYRRRHRTKTTGSMARASDESIGSSASGGPASHDDLLGTYDSTSTPSQPADN